MPDSLDLKLSPADLDYVYRLLVKQPWAEVNHIVVSIQHQIKEQQNVVPKEPPKST